MQFYRVNPIAFIEVYILAPKSKKDGIDYKLTPQQIDFINGVNDPSTMKALCKAGRGTGKTMLLSCLAIWFAVCFPESKVFITGPSEKQVKKALFSEIKLWLSNSAVDTLFTTTETRVYMTSATNDCHKIEIVTAPKGQPTNLSGLHAKNMLIVADEVFGNEDDNLVHLEKSLTSSQFGIQQFVGVGNPTTNMGFAAEKFKMLAPGWYLQTMNAEDSPLSDKEDIAETLHLHGRDHIIYRSSVLGEFPLADSDAFIGLYKVERAFANNIEQPYGTVEIACDVARMGADKTVCMWRWGNKVYPPRHLDKTDSYDIANLIASVSEEARKKTHYTGIIKVKIDTSGGWGAGAFDMLTKEKKYREYNLEIIGVNFSKSANNKSRYKNLPTEMWATVRDLINEIDLPSPEDFPEHTPVLNRMKNELAARRVVLDGNTVEMVESKTRYKQEFKHSPDFADTVIMLFAEIKSERTVLKNFDPVNPSTIVDRAQYVDHYDTFGSLYYSKDGLGSFITARWGDGELLVTDEYVGDDNVYLMSNKVIQMGGTGYKNLLGNDRCFGRSSRDDMRGHLRKYGVKNLKQNYNYDELGALSLLNNLDDQGRLKILRRCESITNQLYEWRMDNSVTVLDNEYGLCYALLNLVSSLKDQIERNSPSQPAYVPYNASERGDREFSNLRSVHIGSML